MKHSLLYTQITAKSRSIFLGMVYIYYRLEQIITNTDKIHSRLAYNLYLLSKLHGHTFLDIVSISKTINDIERAYLNAQYVDKV